MATRVHYKQFLAEMQVGTEEDPSVDPDVWLRWSDTRGASWGNPVRQTLGKGGAYLTSIQWRNLGIARDRVFEISTSTTARTALNGAFIDLQVLGT